MKRSRHSDFEFTSPLSNGLENVHLNGESPVTENETQNELSTPNMPNGYSSTRTPRPTPLLPGEPKSFSTKKARSNGSTPRRKLNLKAPPKSCPQLSRISGPRTIDDTAKLISFKDPNKCLLSKHYDPNDRKSFLEQCFDIVEKLGSGSFGDVYKVRSLDDDHWYAVKKSRERFKGESDRKRKLEEVAKHEGLPDHPNCVRFIKAWEERKYLFIQTELCQMSLDLYADEDHKIPEHLIWNYLVDMLKAVKHLHDHDLVHMDIKPDNIFVTKSNVCKLGDFGLMVKAASEDSVNASPGDQDLTEGDFKYVAPELMRGIAGKPVDVFSLGITILELASDLDMPRGGELWHVLRNGVLPDEFLQDNVSLELYNLIKWMMEPDREKRPKVDEILKHPSVYSRCKQRQLEAKFMAVMQIIGVLWFYIMNAISSIWVVFLFPMKNVISALSPSKSCRDDVTPTPSPGLSPEMMRYSFSDADETFETFGEEISIHNNSMGIPFDSSSSSSDSTRDADGFLIPNHPADKGAMTVPPINKLRTMRTPMRPQPFGLNSPAAAALAQTCYFSSSPVRAPSGPRLSPPVPDSPMQLSPTGITPDDPNKENTSPESTRTCSIAPKNLLNMFDGASDDDDQ